MKGGGQARVRQGFKTVKSDASVLDRWWSRVTQTRTIAADAPTVWAALEHPDWLRWYAPLSDFAVVGGGGVVAGSVLREREWLWKTESVVEVWVEQRTMELSTRAFNVRGLLRSYRRRIELEPTDDGTVVRLTGGFAFGPLGWLFLPWTLPQMTSTLWFEYRSALRGLADLVESGA